MDGKTLGIVGFGRIGSRVAKYAKNFGMNIIVYDPYINKDLADEIGAEITTFDDVLKRSDIITIHAFLSEETRKMINSETFSKMKNTALLINVARGEIVDENALLDALERKRIAGAALDVFSEEPLPPSSKLIEFAINNDNLILTPHSAALTVDSVNKSAREIVQKMKEFLTKNS